MGDKKKMTFIKASDHLLNPAYIPGYADNLLFNIKNRKWILKYKVHLLKISFYVLLE